MTRITAYFNGSPGDPMDRACNHIFNDHGGTPVGAGTWLVGEDAGERDVEYELPAENVEACRAALKKAGFRLQPSDLHDVARTYDIDVPGIKDDDDV
jgi:hypothetical protein